MLTQAHRDALRDTFPTLYSELDTFNVPDTWYTVIHTLSDKIQLIINRTPEGFRRNYRCIRCTQVRKQLVFTMRQSTHEIDDAIAEAQESING